MKVARDKIHLFVFVAFAILLIVVNVFLYNNTIRIFMNKSFFQVIVFSLVSMMGNVSFGMGNQVGMDNKLVYVCRQQDPALYDKFYVKAKNYAERTGCSQVTITGIKEAVDIALHNKNRETLAFIQAIPNVHFLRQIKGNVEYMENLKNLRIED